MTANNSMEVRFVELMSQLFQLGESERLDLGICRVIQRQIRQPNEIIVQNLIYG